MAANSFEKKPFKPPFQIIAKKTKTVNVKYRECRRNHAPLLGINVFDGCGEFAPKGTSLGTRHIIDLDCEACGCHRNFHRKEVTRKLSLTYIENEEADDLAGCHPRQPPRLNNEQKGVENEELDGSVKKPKVSKGGQK